MRWWVSEVPQLTLTQLPRAQSVGISTARCLPEVSTFLQSCKKWAAFCPTCGTLCYSGYFKGKMATSGKHNYWASGSLLFSAAVVILFRYLHLSVQLVFPKTRVTLLRCREPVVSSAQGMVGSDGCSPEPRTVWGISIAQSWGLLFSAWKKHAAVPRLTEQARQH